MITEGGEASTPSRRYEFCSTDRRIKAGASPAPSGVCSEHGVERAPWRGQHGTVTSRRARVSRARGDAGGGKWAGKWGEQKPPHRCLLGSNMRKVKATWKVLNKQKGWWGRWG